jgi:hypothetical protein
MKRAAWADPRGVEREQETDRLLPDADTPPEPADPDVAEADDEAVEPPPESARA